MARVSFIVLVLLLVVSAGVRPGLAAGDGEGQRRFPTTIEECDVLARKSPEDLASYRCYWFVGRNHALLNEAYHRLGSLLEADPRNPRIQLFLGIVAADLGRADAEEILREATDGFSAEGDATGEVYSRLSIAMFLRPRGRLSEASAELERALESAVDSGDADLEAQVRANLGWSKFYEGEYGRAWAVFKQVERDVFPDGAPHLRLDVAGGLAAVCWALGRNAEALEYYRRQIDLLGGGDPFRESSIRKNMALVGGRLAKEGRISDEEMVGMYREAADSAVRAGNRIAEAGGRLLLAGTLDGEEGLEQARRGLALAREMDSLRDTCWALWMIAEKSLDLDPHDPERAFAYIAEGAELARKHGETEILASGLLARANMRWKTGPRAQAIANTFEGLNAVERIRDLQQDGEVKARVFGRYAEAYRGLAAEILASSDAASSYQDLERAFVIMERMHARSLLDTLDAAGATSGIAPTGPLAEDRARVIEEIAAVRKELSRAVSSDEERSRLMADLAQLETWEASLREAISDEDSAFAALRGSSFPGIREVQQALRDDQALLSFVVRDPVDGPGESDPGSWVLVITSDDATVHPVLEFEDMQERLRLYLSLLARRDGSDASGSRRLYQNLLSASVDKLPPRITSLIIVPDGPLHRIPFGALLSADGRPLVQRYEVAMVPSTSTWLRWKEAGRFRSKTSSLIAFADPTPGLAGNGNPMRASGSVETVGGLGPLPHARREAATLRRHLGSDGRVLSGERATEAELKSAGLSDYRVIHLAAHAVVNDEYPERSAVMLAAAPGDDDDGVLRFDEVVGLALDGQVVVLSACRSASGPLIGGEGLMGLANSFFQAGARTVVAGLWPVRDRDAAMLVDRFGHHLGRGRSVTAALTLARRELIRRGVPTAAWAGMVVLGDGDVTPCADERTAGRWWSWPAGIALIVAALLGSAFLLYRRTRV